MVQSCVQGRRERQQEALLLVPVPDCLSHDVPFLGRAGRPGRQANCGRDQECPATSVHASYRGKLTFAGGEGSSMPSRARTNREALFGEPETRGVAMTETLDFTALDQFLGIKRLGAKYGSCFAPRVAGSLAPPETNTSPGSRSAARRKTVARSERRRPNNHHSHGDKT